jgi:hypothetical protein
MAVRPERGIKTVNNVAAFFKDLSFLFSEKREILISTAYKQSI